MSVSYLNETIDSFVGKYNFLSNFYKAPVTINNITYPSSEHAYQAMKTLDIEKQIEFSQIDNPNKAKEFGKKIKIRDDWDKVKVKYMHMVVFQKFMQNQDLKKRLLEIEDGISFVEGNYWHDNIWGVCSCPRCQSKNATNYLGKILTNVKITLHMLENDPKQIMIYLAGPYTHDKEIVVNARYRVFCDNLAKRINEGYNVLSVVTMYHDAAKKNNLSTLWENWKEIDLRFLDMCDCISICCMSEWEKSVGVNEEYNYSFLTKKPILFEEPVYK